MIYNDYIMRMIMQFSRVMGVLIGLIRERKPEQAFAMIDDVYKLITGLDSDKINALSEQDLLNIMMNGDTPQIEKILMIARLLKEEGDIYTSMYEEQESYQRHAKSLSLFFAAAKQAPDTNFIDYHTEIEQLLHRLSIYELPDQINNELWRYYGTIHQFSLAENILFELLESETDVQLAEALIADGLKFYEQLLSLDDALLKEGGLPRDEIVDAIEQLNNWFTK